jgi:RNA 3'-terminal phosphate cyclase (ATP)
MILIDGAQGEGGGQVLRAALTFSILSGEGIHLTNVRANRRNPGLAPQHLAGVLAAAKICSAEAHGTYVGSTEVAFTPGGLAIPGEYRFDVSKLAGQGSAGSVTLLLQTILLPLALAAGSSRLTLRGGTHVAWSPPVHYLEWALFPALRRLGVEAEIELKTWGWYPEGGGEAEVTIRGGARPAGQTLVERGELLSLRGVAVASNLPSHIPQRIGGRVNNRLREAGLPARVEPLRLTGPSSGAGVFLGVDYEGVSVAFDALGRRGKPSEEVANEAADALIAYHEQDRPLDTHLPDQLLSFLAVAEGDSEVQVQAVSRHLLTIADVIGHFADRPIHIEGKLGEPGVVRVTGAPPEWESIN